VKELSWTETFCVSKYNGAAWMALAVAFSFNSNGIAGVFFYSATIFEKANFPVSLGNIIVMAIFPLACIPFIFLLARYGRRTILVTSLVVIDISLFLMATCVIYKQTKLMLVFMCIFVFAAQG